MHPGTSHPNGRYRQVPATYTPVVTSYIASQLAHVGRVRVSECLRRGVHKGNQITVMKNVMTSQVQVDDTLWMQGSVEMYGKVLDVHRFLLGNVHDLHAIRSLFGPMFLDGYVLRSLPNSQEGGAHERMSINWMAMQSPHTSLSDRDFLFLHYTDVYVRDHDQLRPVAQTKPSDHEVLTACHVWESVELDGVPVLDHLDLARQRLSSWGFLVEALDHGRVRVTINVNQPKASASHRSWMEKLVVSLNRLEGLLYDRYDDGPCCNACTKTFSLLRRRLQCKQCKMSFCSKCAAQGVDLIVACRECASRHRIDNPSSHNIPLLQRTSSTSSFKSRRHDNLSQGPLKTSSSTSSSDSFEKNRHVTVVLLIIPRATAPAAPRGMSFLRPTTVCVFVQWVFHLYLPFALVLFVYRSNHTAIKYRQPGMAAVTGFVFAAYTLALPPIVCFDTEDAIDIYTRIFVSKALILVGGVSFILSQVIIVVKFAITEMLLDPRTATEARVHRVQSLRWLLYPRAQVLAWLATSAVVCSPILHLLLFLPDHFTSTNLVDGLHPTTQTLNIVSTLEVAAMTAISWGLTRKISRVVDNFGLRNTYISISKYIAVCLCGYGLTSLLPLLGVAAFLDEFYASAMIVMHGGQALCFMLITMPLRQSYLTVETHREMRIRRRRLQTEVDELDYKVFYRYLSTSEGFTAVLAFCRMELAPELLLAWHEVEKYKRGEATVDDIYDKVLDPHSELFQVDLADEVRNMYAQKRVAVCTPRFRSTRVGTFRSWKNKVDVLLQPAVVAAARKSVVEATKLASVVPTPEPPGSSLTSREKCDPTFFHPLSAELLRLLYLHVLPRFEEFPPSNDWIVFRNSEKAMVSLDAVDNMVRKTMVVARPLASMTPNIEDIPRTGRMLTMPQEELQ